jgi:hypothetical protein
VHFLSKQIERGSKRRAASGADVNHRRKGIDQPARDRVLEPQSPAHELGELAVAAIAQDRVVVVLLLVREIRNNRELERSPSFDAVAGAVRSEREIPRLQLISLPVDLQLTSPRGHGVEPHATRRGRQRAAPRLPHEGRTIEHTGDRDVTQRVGDRGHCREEWFHADQVAPTVACSATWETIGTELRTNRH